MGRRLTVALVLVAGLGIAAWLGPLRRLVAAPAAQPRIVLDARSGTIDVRGISDPGSVHAGEWKTRLTVRPASAGDDLPPVAGSYEATADAVRFRPRFALVPGLPYQVRYESTETTVMLPRVSRPSRTRVTAIHPSADELPANQLKFYVSFSAPMSTGEARDRIHLVDESGREVSRAFLWLEQELWDAQRRRLTLILDPGRVKRGLRANVEEGAPLREGKRYRLVVDAAWSDGDGDPLQASIEKTFRVVAPDRKSPDTFAWRLHSPVAGTRNALLLDFDESLDFALLHEMLIVRNEKGAVLDGQVTIGADDRSWQFVPSSPWSQGRYSIDVSPDLEDLAGNDLRRLFDVDLQSRSEPRRARVQWTFNI